MSISLDSLSFSSMTEGKTEDVIKDLKYWSEQVNQVTGKKDNQLQLLLTIKFVGHYISEKAGWASREQKAQFIVDVSNGLNGFRVQQINPMEGSSTFTTGTDKAARKLVFGKIKMKAQILSENLTPSRKTFIYNPRDFDAMQILAHHGAPKLNWNS